MDNLGFGLSLTVAGLGIVFGMLILLWLLLSLALRLERRATTTVLDAAVEPGVDPAPDSAPDPRLIAAITVAVVRHTDALRRQAAPAMRSHAPGSLLFASHWVASGRTRQGQPWRRRAR